MLVCSSASVSASVSLSLIVSVSEYAHDEHGWHAGGSYEQKQGTEGNQGIGHSSEGIRGAQSLDCLGPNHPERGW